MNIYKVTTAAAAAGTAHGHQRTRMRHAARRHREWPGPHRMEPSHARPGPSRAERCNRKQSKLICSLVCFGQMYLKSVNVSAGCLTHSAQILCACVCGLQQVQCEHGASQSALSSCRTVGQRTVSNEVACQCQRESELATSQVKSLHWVKVSQGYQLTAGVKSL